MKFLIISHVRHKKDGDNYFGYAPYIREMNVWLKHVDEVEIIAPLGIESVSPIDAFYKHSKLRFNAVPEIQFTSLKTILKSILVVPFILFNIFKACHRADHIHLRCPGNMGLLGCLVQIFFPKKSKTAKYAGNWDPNSKQPLSYRFQKYILSKTSLTKNIHVLVYGDFGQKNINIKPFFTASYYKNEIEKLTIRDYSKQLKFLFVGSLVKGKRPLFSLQIIKNLIDQGLDATIDFYGEGLELNRLENYVIDNNLNSVVKFKGNQSKEDIKRAFKTAHFLILPSKSEGWPKAVAEAMFFGVIPIATRISCIPYMLGKGSRGILINIDIKEATTAIINSLNSNNLIRLQENGVTWSQKHTLDEFEKGIKELLLN